MLLTPYDWIYGIATLAAVILSIVAGVIALTLFESARQRKYLAAWKPLLIALILFAAEELIGSLKVFGVWQYPGLTHVLPSFILIFLIAALIKQINIARGYGE